MGRRRLREIDAVYTGQPPSATAWVIVEMTVTMHAKGIDVLGIFRFSDVSSGTSCAVPIA